jgi:predicted transcriptional regulator YdeE
MDAQAQPRIEDRPACTAIGIGMDCPNHDTSGIGSLWDSFIPRLAELPPAAQTYGISLPLPSGGTGFRYYACAIVPDGTLAPEGMEAVALPACRFLVREFHDTMDKLPAAFQELYRTDIPARLTSPSRSSASKYYSPVDGRRRRRAQLTPTPACNRHSAAARPWQPAYPSGCRGCCPSVADAKFN